MNRRNSEIELQVLICTFGKAGIRRIAEASHPRIPGVEYIVSWQLGDSDGNIPASLQRDDFHILLSDSRGLSHNRNITLDAATAPICLIADDDLTYNPDAFRNIIAVFNADPQLGIAAFRYSGGDGKHYPDHEFDLRRPPKDYYVSSIELAFRRESVLASGIRFDLRFGIGAEFPSGEENIWLHQLLHAGLKGKFFPITIANHEALTTGSRLGADPQFIRTKGSVMRILFPRTWPLRLLTHALRNFRHPEIPTRLYIRSWLAGAKDIKIAKTES